MQKLIDQLQASLDEMCALLAAPENALIPALDAWDAPELAAHMLLVEIDCWHYRIQTIAANKQPHIENYYHNTRWDLSVFALHPTLTQWREWRLRNLQLVTKLTPEQRTFTGTHVSFGTITIVDLLQIALDHDQEHIQQVNHRGA